MIEKISHSYPCETHHYRRRTVTFSHCSVLSTLKQRGMINVPQLLSLMTLGHLLGTVSSERLSHFVTFYNKLLRRMLWTYVCANTVCISVKQNGSNKDFICYIQDYIIYYLHVSYIAMLTLFDSILVSVKYLSLVHVGTCKY